MLKVFQFSLAAGLCLALSAAWATDPEGGTLSESSRELTASGGPYTIPNPAADCELADCDTYTLTVELPAGYAAAHSSDSIQVDLTWDPQEADLDLQVLDASGNEVASSGEGPGTPERASFPVQSGTNTYSVVIIPYAPVGATATLSIKFLSAGGGSGGAPAVISNAVLGGPRFDLYRPPAFLGNLRAAEPTMDVNMGSDNAFMLFETSTTKTEFDDAYSPALSTWTDVTDPISPTAGTDDPIFVSDYAYDADGYPDVNEFTRLFNVHLHLPAASHIAYSDDEGVTWLPGEGGGQPHGIDNQSMAAGPYVPGSAEALNPLYRHAVYYCSHSIVNAFCSRSDNGGISFNPAVPIFTPVQASSLACNNHGHVKVAPDGTVYVPQETCEGVTGVVVSEDNGLSWEYRPVPSTVAGTSDTSVGIARDGTIYHGFASGADGRPWVGVSKDRGLTYSNLQPIDGPLGLRNTVWVECVAGDADRAACAFHGTTESGDSFLGDFAGVWYTYLAYTYDGGLSWLVQDLAPNDPVQRGGICLNGLGCPAVPPNRNLLDFFDVVLDSKGRVLVGYADGCVGACVPAGGPPTYSARGVIARQTAGKTLYAKFDPVGGPTAPRGPLLAATRNQREVSLNWIAPYDGGSDISGYKVYRGTAAGAETLLTQTSKPGYVDSGASDSATAYFYRITALNSVGESIPSNEVSPEIVVEVVETACLLPGVKVMNDASGDSVDGMGYSDIESIHVAEPGNLDNQLVFTFKVADLANVPAGLRWTIRFKLDAKSPAVDGAEDYYVAMSTENSATPEFVYGTSGVVSDPAVGLAGARLFTPIGDLDAGSAYGEDGTIVLILDKAKIESPQPGQNVTSIAGSVRTPATPQNYGILDDTATDGLYAVRGNQPCAGKSAPLALISATPTSGAAPLKVVFDARSSQSAATIASYTFRFGDGSAPLEDSDGVVEHTYRQNGIYRPTVTLRDVHGNLSTNFAEAQIIVGNATAAVKDTSRFGSGALGAPLLLILGLLALRRRR